MRGRFLIKHQLEGSGFRIIIGSCRIQIGCFTACLFRTYACTGKIQSAGESRILR